MSLAPGGGPLFRPAGTGSVRCRGRRGTSAAARFLGMSPPKTGLRGVRPVRLNDPLQEGAQGPQPLPVGVSRQGALDTRRAGRPDFVVLDVVAADTRDAANAALLIEVRPPRPRSARNGTSSKVAQVQPQVPLADRGKRRVYAGRARPELLAAGEEQVFPVHDGGPGSMVVAAGEVGECLIECLGAAGVIGDAPVDGDGRAVAGLEVVTEVLRAGRTGQPGRCRVGPRCR